MCTNSSSHIISNTCIRDPSVEGTDSIPVKSCFVSSDTSTGIRDVSYRCTDSNSINPSLSNICIRDISEIGVNNINTGSSPNSSTDFSEIDSDYHGESLNSVSSDNVSVSSSADSLDDSQSTINFSLKEKGGLKCFYTNCDSIANKWSELEALIYIHQPDIIGLTEAFSKRNESINMSEYEIDGFQQFSNPRFVGKGNRGTILFIRSDLEANLYNRMNDRSCKEACWCEVKINGNDKLLIGIVYRSPNSPDENNQKLNDMISALNNEPHSRKVIMGDFNYREINWDHWLSNTSETHYSHEFIESVRDSFLHQFVDFHTRYRDKQNPSLLDLVFANDELLIENINQFSPVGRSDHLIITFNIVCVVNQTNNSTTKYLFDRGDYLSMNMDLSSVDWHKEFEAKCIEEKWDILKSKLHSSMDKYIPKNKYTRTNSRKGKPVWMTRQALKAVKRKHKSWNKYQQTKEHIHFQYFCRDRNIATRECRKARSEFEQKLSEEGNPKAFYKYANSRRKVKVGVSELKREDGTFAENDNEKANELNNFFKDVFVIEDKNNIPTTNDCSGGNKISDVYFDTDTVSKLLEKLNVNKSSGPDLLHPRVLKELKTAIALPLTLICNHSFDNGVLVDDWKTAHVKPLFKKGSRDSPGNYRPISLTCIPCKMMERIVRDGLVNYMNSNKLFSNSQYGFRSLRSCALQLLEVMEKWTEWIDEGKNFDCIYFDFKKAFDTVAHERLLVKLKSYGIDGKLLTWIEAFLFHRKQCVIVNDNKSNWSEVSSGIPQGSVLGPTLFLIYINDIETEIQSIIRLFADDTKLFNIADTDTDKLRIQNDTDKLEEWSEKWLLKFNVDKCCTMHYGHNNTEHTYYLNKDGLQSEISPTEETRDLGVVFDTDLKFRQHISNSINKANRITGLIRRTFLHVSRKSFRKLYKTLIRPHLEYGNIVWNPRFRKDIEAIERAQKRATKLVHNVRNLSYTERLKILKIPTLSYRRFRGDMIEVYKLLYKLEDIDYTVFFQKCDHYEQNIRGHQFKLRKKSCKKEIRKHFFSLRVISDWNALPEFIVSAPTLNSFKNRLDTFMGDRQFTAIPDNNTWVSNQEGVTRVN